MCDPGIRAAVMRSTPMLDVNYVQKCTLPVANGAPAFEWKPDLRAFRNITHLRIVFNREMMDYVHSLQLVALIYDSPVAISRPVVAGITVKPTWPQTLRKFSAINICIWPGPTLVKFVMSEITWELDYLAIDTYGGDCPAAQCVKAASLLSRLPSITTDVTLSSAFLTDRTIVQKLPASMKRLRAVYLDKDLRDQILASNPNIEEIVCVDHPYTRAAIPYSRDVSHQDDADWDDITTLKISDELPTHWSKSLTGIQLLGPVIPLPPLVVLKTDIIILDDITTPVCELHAKTVIVRKFAPPGLTMIACNSIRFMHNICELGDVRRVVYNMIEGPGHFRNKRLVLFDYHAATTLYLNYKL